MFLCLLRTLGESPIMVENKLFGINGLRTNEVPTKTIGLGKAVQVVLQQNLEFIPESRSTELDVAATHRLGT